MTNPCPGYSISTPYWKAGSAWGCGYHDGCDYAAPAGTDVVAAWSGEVVEAAYPTSFGSAFGRAVVIDHDKLPDGNPGGWGLYAHLSAEQVSRGQRVEAGQKIGDVGTTGNSSGNHLHFGVYMTDHWTSCGGVNPQPWINAGTTSTGGDEVWTDYSGKPSGTLTISNAQDYVSMDFVTEDPPSSGLEFHLLYANCELTWSGSDPAGIIRVKYRRDDGDDTAYQDYAVPKGAALGSPDTFLLTATHWESGEKGLGGRWYMRCEGGISSMKIGTRYAKIGVVS
jgi:Peptidase family M23